MRIYAFTQYYPSTFKPYFDTQFAQFVRDGHQVTVFAHGRQGPVVNEKVARHGLDGRVRRYPTTLRTLPASLPAVFRSVALGPSAARRRWGTVPPGSWKDRMMHGARLLGLPGERPDLCLVHDLTTAAWFTSLRAAYPGVPVAMYYHGGENARSAPIGEEQARAAFRGVDVVFTNTGFSRDHAVSRGCPEEKVVIVPVGFSLDDYRPPAVRRYRPGGVLRLLTAGRMSEEKGHRYALEAVRRLVEQGVTGLRYAITGDGYVRPLLERYVAEHGLESYVEFTGTLTTGELVARIGEADVVLLPSIELGNWVENQACIVQEAMLMKALVVATTAGGVPESTAPELRDFMVPPGDPDAIVRSLLAIVALDEHEMRALGEAGRAFAERRYDIRLLNRILLERAVRKGSSPDRGTSPSHTVGTETG